MMAGFAANLNIKIYCFGCIAAIIVLWLRPAKALNKTAQHYTF